MSAFSLSLRDDRGPLAAVEVASHRVSALRLSSHGAGATIAAHATVPVPEGALAPGLTSSNVRDRGTLAAAVRQVLTAIGSPRRVGLIVPDPVAKVSLVTFQQVPSRSQDLDQLVRWQVRKAAPFPIDDAQVSYVPGAVLLDGHEFIVSLARRDVVAEYEGLCAEAGATAGIVDISTFNVVNAVLASGKGASGDWLLVNVAADWTSLAILRGANLIFFRSRSVDGEGTLADLVHQTAMYYEDRLSGSGFGRVVLCGAASASARQAADVGALRRSLEERLGTSIEPVDARSVAMLGDRIDASPALLDTLAPLVGLLARYREVAA